jgi:hypothetical protein
MIFYTRHSDFVENREATRTRQLCHIDRLDYIVIKMNFVESDRRGLTEQLIFVSVGGLSTSGIVESVLRCVDGFISELVMNCCDS